MKILVTGSAGFIGFHLVTALLQQDDTEITGLDNINDYYDINLKYGRLKEHGILKENIDIGEEAGSIKYKNYSFVKMSIEDREKLYAFFEEKKFDYICHLAAQAGVRHSITNPHVYIDSNITGFLNILEACRYNNIKHLVFASSSSVYGLNREIPFSTDHRTDKPASLYGATKKANELMAHSYSYLYNIPMTGLRFFTVYGPWGRPDMALFIFTKSIIEGKPVDVFNYGKMERDFTYIDDIIQGLIKVIYNSPRKKEAIPVPFTVYNIGNNKPVNLIHFIEIIEKKLGKKCIRNFLPVQPGDVTATWAKMDDFNLKFDYRAVTSVEEGISKFIDWYKDFYNIEL